MQNNYPSTFEPLEQRTPGAALNSEPMISLVNPNPGIEDRTMIELIAASLAS